MEGSILSQLSVAIEARRKSLRAKLLGARVEPDGIVVAVESSLEDGSRLKVGDRVTLQFDEGPLAAGKPFQARLVKEARDGDLLRFRFLLEDGARTVLSPLLNRRTAERVRPDPREPVLARIQFSDIRPVVKDLSPEGLSFLIPRSSEQELFHLWTFRMELQLPGDESLLHVAARVLHRRLVGDTVQYGLRFEELEPGDAERLEGYVRARA